MSARGWLKLHRALLDSSLMNLSPASRWLWVVLLLEADQSGFVAHTVGSLARRADLAGPEVSEILRSFQVTDPESRNPHLEGVRLVAENGGFQIVNFISWARGNPHSPEAKRKRKERSKVDEDQPKGMDGSVTSRDLESVTSADLYSSSSSCSYSQTKEESDPAVAVPCPSGPILADRLLKLPDVAELPAGVATEAIREFVSFRSTRPGERHTMAMWLHKAKSSVFTHASRAHGGGSKAYRDPIHTPDANGQSWGPPE